MDLSSKDMKLVAQCCKVRRTRRRRIILALTIALCVGAVAESTFHTILFFRFARTQGVDLLDEEEDFRGIEQYDLTLLVNDLYQHLGRLSIWVFLAWGLVVVYLWIRADMRTGLLILSLYERLSELGEVPPLPGDGVRQADEPTNADSRESP